jgi:O-methyltransferase
LRNTYINLLQKSLTMTLWEAQDGSQKQPSNEGFKTRISKAIKGLVRRETTPLIDPRTERMEGRDWPNLAHTMIGTRRMENLRFCVEDVIKNGVQGDLIETGVWRGGACIFMRGILKAYGVTDRNVWVADSFAGLPPPNAEQYPADADDTHHKLSPLAISLDQVQSHFEKYGLLDGQVRFLKGWFKDTLPVAPIKSLAIARLDGDMYESTMDGLTALYPKLTIGGYLIVDDYGAVPACAQAVEDYRRQHGITDSIQVIDWGGVFWQRTN